MRPWLPLAALVSANVASIGGTRLSTIAIPWLVLTTTSSPLLTGLVAFAEMLPYVIAKALCGPLIDRIGARRIAIVCDCLSAGAMALIPLLYLSGMLSIWLLMPAVALVGMLRAPSDASKQALVPHIAEIGDMPLERVTGALAASERLAGTLGAAGAGALIALLGTGPALLVNAASFLVAALIVAIGVPAKVASGNPAEKRSYGRDFAEGWTALRDDPVLVGLVCMIAVTNLFDQAYGVVLLPVWVKAAGLDVTWVGIFLATFSATAIAGSVLAAAVANRVPRLLIYVVGFICAGPLPYFTFAATPSVPTILAVLLLGGFTAGFLNPIIGALLFERIPSAMVGRVIALFGALAWALMPFGGLYAGFLVDNAGIHSALVITGMLYLVAALAPLAIPRFRQMNRRGTKEKEDGLRNA